MCQWQCTHTGGDGVTPSCLRKSTDSNTIMIRQWINLSRTHLPQVHHTPSHACEENEVRLEQTGGYKKGNVAQLQEQNEARENELPNGWDRRAQQRSSSNMNLYSRSTASGTGVGAWSTVATHRSRGNACRGAVTDVLTFKFTAGTSTIGVTAWVFKLCHAALPLDALNKVQVVELSHGHATSCSS